MYLHFSKYSSAISRHGNHRNRNYSGQAVAESLRHGTRSNSQYMFTEVAALFQKRASLLGNEKRQIDATFGTSDSSQSHERTRPRHHPTALPITKMASGVLPFRSHGEKAVTSSDRITCVFTRRAFNYFLVTTTTTTTTLYHKVIVKLTVHYYV